MTPTFELNPNWKTKFAGVPYHSLLSMPKEYAKGALERKCAKRLFKGPRFQDRIEVIPESDWSAFINAPNYGWPYDFVHHITDQNQVGSCASEATTQCTMLVRAIAGLLPIILNPWTLYPHVNGGRDQGSTLDDNVNASSRIGIVPMDEWGREHGWQSRIPADIQNGAKRYRIIEWFEIRSKVEYGTALIKKFPVFYGREGHAITGVELLADGVKAAGSWGDYTDCDDPGFHYDPWGKIERAISSYGCFAARAVTIPTEEQ